MNNPVTKPPEVPNLTLLILEERQATILIAITQTRRKPSVAVLEELAELGIALEDSTEVNHVQNNPHPS